MERTNIGIIRHISHSESRVWRMMAGWRVKAQIAIGVLERVIASPDSVMCADELCPMPYGEWSREKDKTTLHVYADDIRGSFVDACKEEIVRLKVALNDDRLLVSIYGRNVEGLPDFLKRSAGKRNR